MLPIVIHRGDVDDLYNILAHQFTTINHLVVICLTHGCHDEEDDNNNNNDHRHQPLLLIIQYFKRRPRKTTYY